VHERWKGRYIIVTCFWNETHYKSRTDRTDKSQGWVSLNYPCVSCVHGLLSKSGDVEVHALTQTRLYIVLCSCHLLGLSLKCRNVELSLLLLSVN